MLETGIKGYQEFTVTEADTAKAHKSGTLNVLATPRMAALMEEHGIPAVGKVPSQYLFPQPVGGAERQVSCPPPVLPGWYWQEKRSWPSMTLGTGAWSGRCGRRDHYSIQSTVVMKQRPLE